MKSLLLQEEIGPHKACVYVLFNHAGAYVGKADLMRQNSLTFATQGVASRLSEHLRSVLRPFSAQGQKPRYKLLRRSIGSIAFLPIQTYASPEQAFAAEALASAWNVRPETSWMQERLSSRLQRQGALLQFEALGGVQYYGNGVLREPGRGPAFGRYPALRLLWHLSRGRRVPSQGPWGCRYLMASCTGLSCKSSLP